MIVRQLDLERIERRNNEIRLFGDLLFGETEGKNFTSNEIKWRENFDLIPKDGKKMLRTLASSVHGLLENVGERTWVWTAAALEIKEAGLNFIDMWPARLREIKLAEKAGPAPEHAPTPEPAPASDTVVVIKPAGEPPVPEEMPAMREIPPIPELHGGEPEELLREDFDQSTRILPGQLLTALETAPQALDLPPLFLTVAEVPVFQLLSDAQGELLSLDFFLGLGLENEDLDAFLAKMCQFRILADGPEVVGQERVLVFNKLAYEHCAGNFFQISSSAALDRIQDDMTRMEMEQYTLNTQLREKTVTAVVAENQYRQKKTELDAIQLQIKELCRLLAEAEAGQKEVLRGLEEAEFNMKAADAAVTAISSSIAAADLESRISAFQELEVTATRLNMLHSLEEQHRLVSYLIISGKGA